jgi:hypothetical protein
VPAIASSPVPVRWGPMVPSTTGPGSATPICWTATAIASTGATRRTSSSPCTTIRSRRGPRPPCTMPLRCRPNLAMPLQIEAALRYRKFDTRFYRHRARRRIHRQRPADRDPGRGSADPAESAMRVWLRRSGGSRTGSAGTTTASACCARASAASRVRPSRPSARSRRWVAPTGR